MPSPAGGDSLLRVQESKGPVKATRLIKAEKCQQQNVPAPMPSDAFSLGLFAEMLRCSTDAYEILKGTHIRST